MTPIAVPNLKASERAFSLDTEDIAVVEITDAESHDENTLVMRVDCRLVTPEGHAVTSAKGVPVTLPTYHVSAQISVLGDESNDVTPDCLMAAETVTAVERMKKHAAALRAWHSAVPSATPGRV